MDRWLFSLLLACSSALLWPVLPPPWLILLLILIFLLSWRHGYLTLNGAALGILWMASVGHWQAHWQLPKGYFNETVMIRGTVDSIVSDQRNPRFNFRVLQVAEHHYDFLPPVVRLSWRLPPDAVQQGQAWQLKVKLKPISGLANEAGFNYQRWLFSHNIKATGYVKNNDAELLTPTISLRQQLLNQMQWMDLKYEGWILALALGYRGELAQQDWQLLQHSGLSHLVAISGLHLGMVTGLLYGVLAFAASLLRQVGVIGRQRNIQRPLLLICLVATLGYAYLSGFALPVIRAWLMLALALTLMLLRWHWSVVRVLLVTMAITLVVMPLSLFALSFWLSYFAVATIMLVFWLWPDGAGASTGWGRILTVVKMQLCLTLFMLPFIAWQMGLASIWTLPINLVAVPFVTLLLLPLCLLATLVLLLALVVEILTNGLYGPVLDFAKMLFVFADDILGVALNGLQALPLLSQGIWRVPDIGAVAWVLILVALLLVCLPRLPFPKGFLLLFLVPGLARMGPLEDDSWRVKVLDVGHGLAVLVEKNGHALLYDTGAAYPSGFSMVESVVLPTLNAQGVHYLDAVVISHDDNDHAGGLPLLLNHIPVARVITTQNGCEQGKVWHWQGLEMQFLWPVAGYQGNANNSSCVLRIRGYGRSVLLTGDIERPAENQLLQLLAKGRDAQGSQPQTLRSDILIAPHHGSNTSSSPAFVAAVDPDYVVFSQSYRNRWRFPKPEVVERYQAYTQDILQTANAGQVTFSINSRGEIHYLTERQGNKRWFLHRP